jgi:predicted nuclease of restriction endonuclease-like (RecB) superfamily
MLMNNKEYLTVFEEIKTKIRSARRNAILAVNNEMVMLYWNIGNIINAKSKWGNKFIENLAKDIKLEFPTAKGYSVRNLKYMAKFTKTTPDFEIVQTISAQLSWSHNTALLDKVKDEKKRLWYAKKAIENGWTLDTMEQQIESEIYERQAIAKKTSNYQTRLPQPQGDLAVQTLKDPYVFDFITYHEGMIEHDIENELCNNITKFLLELGSGFAFVGKQYHLEIENEDFYIDLLFYHLKLHCYVVIELKTGKFKPEYAGKLNFYLSAIDDLLRTDNDNPSIGILLCKDKKGMIAEYALKDIEKPIGVSEYKLFEKLPQKYKKLLPSAADIEKHIGQKPEGE